MGETPRNRPSVHLLCTKRRECIPRRRKPYTLHRRQIPGNKRPIFYYTINPESGVPRELCESRKSTGLHSQTDAIRFVRKRIAELQASGVLHTSNPTLGEFMAAFYDPLRCPHMARVGKDRFSPKAAKVYGGLVVNHTLTDEIAQARLKDLRPMHLSSFRRRLEAKTVSRLVKVRIAKTSKLGMVERKSKLFQSTVRKVLDTLRVPPSHFLLHLLGMRVVFRVLSGPAVREMLLDENSGYRRYRRHRRDPFVLKLRADCLRAAGAAGVVETQPDMGDPSDEFFAFAQLIEFCDIPYLNDSVLHGFSPVSPAPIDSFSD